MGETGSPNLRLEESPWKAEFPLRADVTYLNHGSFGPSPRCVREERQRWTERLETQPMQLFVRDFEDSLDAACQSLGEFVGAPAKDLIFVDNATFGMNIVAASVALKPGDEVLLTDHEYGAVVRIWRRTCQAAGAKVVTANLPLTGNVTPISGRARPISGSVTPIPGRARLLPSRGDDPESHRESGNVGDSPRGSAGASPSHRNTVEALFDAVTERTRLIVVSHVTSTTAIILPVEQICREAKSRGIPVCIDGPHAVGMLSLSLRKLGCDFYAASCHKWLCGPFGSGFLYVSPQWQGKLQPAVVSWGGSLAGRQPSWKDEFQWIGTRDPAAFLAVPAAIEFLDDIGWNLFRDRGHELAREFRVRMQELTGLPPMVPDSPECFGTMAAMPLPESNTEPPKYGLPEPLNNALWDRFRVEIPVVYWQNRRLIRASFHLYNDRADLDRLFDSLATLLPEFSR